MAKNKITISAQGKGVRVKLPIDVFASYMDHLDLECSLKVILNSEPSMGTLEAIQVLMAIHNFRERNGGSIPKTLEMIETIAKWGHKKGKPVLIQTSGLKMNNSTPGA